MARLILIGLIILTIPVAWFCLEVSTITTRNAESIPTTVPLDIGKLGVQYPEIAAHVIDRTLHQFGLLTMWEDTFIVEYATEEATAIYFYSRCTDLSSDHFLQKPKANGSCGSNALGLGPVVYIEHHQLHDPSLELCGISGDQPFIITTGRAVAEQAGSVAYGHPEAPRIMMRFEREQHIEVTTFENGASRTVVAIRWHNAT